MAATRIIAVRHGETAWNLDTRIQGHTDIGLNERGLWQAQRVGEALAEEPIARVYTSDLSRAHTTAQAIAQRNALLAIREPHIHTGLRERHFGIFEGQTHADIANQWPELHHRWRVRDPHFAPDGGESLVQVRERVLNTVNALASQHLGELIVLVAHGGVMDALYRLATGQEIEAPRTWRLNNAAINRLLWTPDALTLVGWADTQHLDEPGQDESIT